MNETQMASDTRYTLFSNQDLLRLIIPLIIDHALFITVGAADSMMVASLGENSVSAVSVVDMVNIFIGNIYMALATGGAVVASQYMGAKNHLQARYSAKHLLAVTLVFSFVLLLICQVFNQSILRLLFGELEPGVMAQATKYFYITALTYPFVAVYCSCAALFRSMNKASYTMYSSFLSNVLNVVGNALLIFIFKMGVAGAAWSTLFARIVSTLFLLLLLTNKANPIFISIGDGFRLSWGIIRKILYIGIPSSVENSVFQLGRLLVVGIIAKFGTTEIAANAVANQIDYLGCLIGASFSLAMITVVGQCVGAGSEAQTRFYISKMMKWAYAGHIGSNVILFMLTPLLLMFYSKLSSDTMHLAVWLIVIHNGLGMLLWPASFVFPNVLRAANDVRFTMLASIISMFVVRLGFSYAIAAIWGLGALGVWIAMIFDWIVRIVCFSWRYKSNAWLHASGLK